VHATAEQRRQGLLPNALGVAGDWVASLACAGPSTGVAFTLAALLALSGLASPLVILVCGVGVLLVAIGYARLNRWRANAGAPYVWVGAAVTPVLGFAMGILALMIGFLVNIGNITLAGSYLLGIVNPGASFPKIVIWLVSAAYMAVVIYLAVRGIRPSMRVQGTILGAEYTIIIAFAIASLFYESSHHHLGAVTPSWSYFSVHSSAAGFSGLAAAAVIGGFLFGGWEAPFMVSEESRDPNFNPGRAAILGVLAALIWYLVLFIVFQGIAAPSAIGAHGADVLGYAGTLVAPSPLDRLLPLAVFSAIFAATQMQLVEASRVMFSMGRDKLLPARLGEVSPRFRTPWAAALVLGVLPPIILIPYLWSSNASKVIDDIVGAVGLLYLVMYTVIPLSCAWFARRALRGPGIDMLIGVIAPLIGGLFMGALFVYGLKTQPETASVVAGVVLAVCLAWAIAAKLGLRNPYFQQPRIQMEAEELVTLAPAAEETS
jgi:amino acid transporter